MPEELLDVLDEAGHVLDQVPRSQAHDEGLLHAVVHVLLLGPDGQILLQRRSQSKRVYPDLWTSSASGHVSAGQTPLEAAAREVEEELGCRAQALEQVDVHRFQDPDVGENERVHVFLAGATGRLDPDAREVSATRWIQPEDLDAWLQRSPDAFAPSFPPVWAGAQAHVLGKP